MDNQERIAAWLVGVVEAEYGTLILGNQDNLDEPPEGPHAGDFFLVPKALKPRAEDLNVGRNKIGYALVGMWSNNDFRTWQAAIQQTNRIIVGLTGGNYPEGVKQLVLGDEATITSRGGILQVELDLTLTVEIE